MSEPPHGYCLEVAPGEDIQLAVARCPLGGAVLLQSGLHLRWHELYLSRDVHIFGRGSALLEVRSRGAMVDLCRNPNSGKGGGGDDEGWRPTPFWGLMWGKRGDRERRAPDAREKKSPQYRSTTGAARSDPQL